MAKSTIKKPTKRTRDDQKRLSEARHLLQQPVLTKQLLGREFGLKASRPRRTAAVPKGPISHVPSRGLVSTQARFPESADEKIVVAKSIVQAVVAAHDAGAMDGENYDIHWPLHMAIDLLEQASTQLEVPHA